MTGFQEALFPMRTSRTDVDLEEAGGNVVRSNFNLK
jgi:hypothetical protein